jgi:hypothetical protein
MPGESSLTRVAGRPWIAADALPLASFDRDQRRYGIATRDP